MEILYLSPQESPSLAENKDFWCIYQTSFPPEERCLPQTLLQDMKETNIHALLLNRERKTIGFLLYQFLESSNVVFLHYFAVDMAYQNQGHGSRLLQRLVDRLKTSCLGLVFELEKPELAITERERKRREHRTEWYKKRGARILVEEYWQPPQEPGLSSVLMSLYFLPSASKVDLDSLKILKMKVLHDLETQVYQES